MREGLTKAAVVVLIFVAFFGLLAWWNPDVLGIQPAKTETIAITGASARYSAAGGQMASGDLTSFRFLGLGWIVALNISNVGGVDAVISQLTADMTNLTVQNSPPLSNYTYEVWVQPKNGSWQLATVWGYPLQNTSIPVDGSCTIFAFLPANDFTSNQTVTIGINTFLGSHFSVNIVLQ